MTEELFLKEVCTIAEKTYWQKVFEIIDLEPDVDVSAETDRRVIEYILDLEHNNLNDNRNPKRTKKINRILKALIVAAILILLLSISAFSFSPVRDFFYRVYNEGTEFIFTYNQNAKSDYLYADYSNIPDGYKLIYNENDNASQRIIYDCDGKQIIIDTRKIKHDSVFIDTENAKAGKTKVGDFEGYYSETSTSIILVWSTGKYYHRIVADLNGYLITLDRVIGIAESSTPKE